MFHNTLLFHNILYLTAPITVPVLWCQICGSRYRHSRHSDFSNVLQADTSPTYNRVISFANSPILTFEYLTIQNMLQLSVLAGLIIRCRWSSIL